MNRTREQILADLTAAAHGPLGRRSLAMTLRKAHTLLIELREDGIGWQQLAQLLAETGHHASGETIRRTFTRITSAKKGDPQLAAATVHAGPTVKDITASSPHQIQSETRIAMRATGPPGARPSASFTPPSNHPGSGAGASLLDALDKIRELNR